MTLRAWPLRLSACTSASPADDRNSYAAAFGGVNYIEFLPSERAVVNPLRIRRDYLNEFESTLIICFTGQSRRSDTIIKEQVSSLNAMNDKTLASMHALKRDALEMKVALLSGDIRGMAEILRSSWELKKRTAAGVSNARVDELHALAMKAGAWSGKVSGAGGGGFLMLMCDPENRYEVMRALNAAGGYGLPVKLVFDGAEGWAAPRCG